MTDHNQLYADFSQWVQNEKGYINHYAGRAEVYQPNHAWSTCAIGCFTKANDDVDTEELLEAIQEVNPGLYDCLNESYPETFEQLAIMVELDSMECQEIHSAALALQQYFGGL